MIRTILMPWDGSDHSQRALEFLLRLLKEQRPAEVHLLNVQHGAPTAERLAGGRPSAIREIEGPALDAGRKLLAVAVERLANAGVPHVTKVVAGDPAHEIIEYAKSHHCEGIVMGTRGLGSIATLVLGSVAHKVVHATPVPLTLVK